MSKVTIFAGTYTDGASRGVYRMILDTLKGTLEGPWLFYECNSPKALHFFHFELSIVCSQQDHAGVALLDTHQPIPYHLDTKMAESIPACAITQDDLFIYTANYHEGTVVVYRKDHGRLKIEERLKLGESAKCHQVFLLDGYLYVVCLGTDRIRIYDPENHFSFVKDIMLPKGSGPRQAVVDQQHRMMYILSELSNEVFVYSIGAHHTFRCQQITSVLPKGCKEDCASAAIRISPNGNYLYTSTRGANVITCFEIIHGNLKQKEIFQCGGEHPRDFMIDETGRWMLVINKDSDNIIVFKLNTDTGEAMEITDEKTVPSGVSIIGAYR